MSATSLYYIGITLLALAPTTYTLRRLQLKLSSMQSGGLQ